MCVGGESGGGDSINNDTWVSQKFCNIFLYASLQCIYYMTIAVQAMVNIHYGWLYCGSWYVDTLGIALLTHCALLCFVCDLKATQMNMQQSNLGTYKFELGYNIAKAIKNICCRKSEGAVVHTIVTRLFKKFCSGCKNLDNQESSGRPENMDSETMLQVIVTNPLSSTWRISDKISISVQCGSSSS